MTIRDEIRELCIAHDKFMAEAREEIRSPPVSETEDAGLIYKEYDNNALPAGSEGDADTFDLLVRFEGLDSDKINNRQVVADALGRLLRRALGALLREGTHR